MGQGAAGECPSWCAVHTSGVGETERLAWHASRFAPVVLDMHGRGPVTALVCVHSRDGDPRVWVRVTDGGRTVIDMPVRGWRALAGAVTAMVERVDRGGPTRG